MVRDEHYLGHTVSLKFEKSYRSSRSQRKPESEWLKIPNTHTAIVDVETWDKAQEVNARLSKCVENARPPQTSLFSGKIFCADCNVIMMFHSEKKSKSSDERRNSYNCKTYHVTGRQRCSRHSIKEDVLKKIVLANIKEQAEQIRLDEDRTLRKLREKLIVGYPADKVELARELQELKQRIHVAFFLWPLVVDIAD